METRPTGAIGLVRANGFGPLPNLFEERAGEAALWRMFEGAGLPADVTGLPDIPIPFRSMVNIIGRCGLYLDDRTFGLDIGEQMAGKAFGRWGQYTISALTLGTAIARLSTTVSAHHNQGTVRLVRDEERLILRNFDRPVDIDRRHHSDHLIPILLGFCRIYLGEDWLPEWIEVGYPHDPGVLLLEERLGVPVHCGKPGVGVPLAGADLAQVRLLPDHALNGPVTFREVVADSVMRDAPEPARSLSALVSLRLLDGRSDIEGAAQLAGLGVQTLQRRLREKGYSYREVVDAARRERAIAMLLETDLSLVQIAVALGYQEHSGFTRAFKRWVGVSPSEFRSICGRSPRTPRLSDANW